MYTKYSDALRKSTTFAKVSLYIIIVGFLYVLFVFKAIAVLSHGKPLFLFDLFTKCYIADDSCPNDNVTFWLYTR